MVQTPLRHLNGTDLVCCACSPFTNVISVRKLSRQYSYYLKCLFHSADETGKKYSDMGICLESGVYWQHVNLWPSSIIHLFIKKNQQNIQ